jgi:hypothetical protein
MYRTEGLRERLADLMMRGIGNQEDPSPVASQHLPNVPHKERSRACIATIEPRGQSEIHQEEKPRLKDLRKPVALKSEKVVRESRQRE